MTSGTSRDRHIHSSADCYRLRAGVHRNNTTHVIGTNDANIMGLRPCKTCFGDVMPDFFKPYCQLCGTWRACAHNGGVAVRTKVGFGWVWPDRVIQHRPLRTV